MPETTLSFEVDTLDKRIQMRGDLQWLRQHPYVISVRQATTSFEPGRSWLVNYADVTIHDRESPRQRELATWLIARENPELPSEAILSEDNLRENEDPSYLARFRRFLRRRDRTPPPQREDARDSLVYSLLTSSEGRSRLAQAMVAPLRERRDYQSIARRSLFVEQLPQGANPIYAGPIDLHREVPVQDLSIFPTFSRETFLRIGEEINNTPLRPERTFMSEQDFADVAQWTASEEVRQAIVNSEAINRIQGRRVVVPEFEIVSNPTIQMSDIQQRRFSILDRPMQPPASWVGVGVWVRSKKDSNDIWIITGMDTYNATLEVWRGIYRTTTIAFGFLEGHYEPCQAPLEVLNRFDRLDLI